MVSEVLVELNSDMEKSVEGLSHEMASIRTGRASPALVEDIPVEYHGAQLPLKQLGNISVPEPTLIAIQPWDRGALRAIEKAIQKANLGLNPSNDGNIIRLPIPPLTEERRNELAKLVWRRVEERKVAVRNIRRDHIARLRRMEKKKEISQDELNTTIKKVDELTEAFIERCSELGRAKEKEIKEL
ncbi:MAG TPA: ribosome recycling factor [Dehalococcoidia bacterium]|nr:ribosome recycling factor [Dehalococcoidia bacterium]